MHHTHMRRRGGEVIHGRDIIESHASSTVKHNKRQSNVRIQVETVVVVSPTWFGLDCVLI